MKLFISSILLAILIFSCAQPDSGDTAGTAQNTDDQELPLRSYISEMISITDNPQIDGVELGTGRNDGMQRLYTTRNTSTFAYELSQNNGGWEVLETIAGTTTCSGPVIASLGSMTDNSFYLGGWSGQGILHSRFSGSSWPASSTIPNSSAMLLAMKAGNGRNDGVTRLYVCGNNLQEYSWDGTDYTSQIVAAFKVGRIGIGDGRNDGTNRIYAVGRGSDKVYEFTWNSATASFDSEAIWTGSSSNGSAFVGDGRGDGVQRLYVWAGELYELTWNGSIWTSLTMDTRSGENWSRYYINIGSIGNNSPGVYVSTRRQGLFEYRWAQSSGTYEVDAISAATGGTAIGDGRNDGVNRLYVARGTKNNYSSSALVEISDGD